MAQLTWTDFSNGEQLSIIRGKINTFNTTTRDSVNDLDTRVTAIESSGIPSIPTGDGRYVLSVSNGIATWETTNA